MKIKGRSYFKESNADLEIFENWVDQLENHNERVYERIEVTTSLGKTHIWGLNTKEENLETLVVFPGARTTSFFWDFDKGLDNLNHKMKIYLVETNGLPNLSDGLTPDIKSLDYGLWAVEVFDKLKIEKAFIAGASFGGLICMKLAIVKPELVKAAFLLNAGCLQPFSLSVKNLYYNLLPIISPSIKNVSKFLDKAIFCKPNHTLSAVSEKLIIDYEVLALTKYKDNTQKPYYMDEELADVAVDTYLLQGDNDMLFPHQKSIDNAKKHIKTLKEIEIFENVGHGIETYAKAMNYIGLKIKNYS
ncbi:alpha/beta fold hydrolase [Flavobacterium aquicola]|uniref:Pimeloyl-ACP methyl ester carboxylesterase n=1 Tax=Flavobacterium aquicola TaxID=1682742 RepID=A0A3E0EDG5_9FLAO|nr:alpha/beta hydrolase [Flavobacterium aquicola]REG96281.1 pimeloyl-ACP methyl ester carboxylesterase [Flavobacterium aquicola]